MFDDMCRQAQRLTYPLLADESGELRKAFGIEPMTRVVSVVLSTRVPLPSLREQTPKPV